MVEKDCSLGKDFVAVLAYAVARSAMAGYLIVPKYGPTGVVSAHDVFSEMEGH
jgi:hypothetical protein